jgi:hypothetical protein
MMWMRLPFEQIAGEQQNGDDQCEEDGDQQSAELTVRLRFRRE